MTKQEVSEKADLLSQMAALLQDSMLMLQESLQELDRKDSRIASLEAKLRIYEAMQESLSPELLKSQR